MARRSPDFSPIDPTQEAIRDELPRDVLSYAEGLRREMYAIARKYGVEKPADIGPKIDSGEVSLEDMDRMVELKKALENAVATKRVPFREREFADALDEVARVVDEYSMMFESPTGIANVDLVGLAKAVESLPIVPFEEFVRNDGFMQRVANAIHSRLTGNSGLLGYAITMIANRTMSRMPPEVRDLVTQRVVGTGMNGLGYKWTGGTLVIENNANSSCGREMTGGEIRVEHVGHNLGIGMRGGKITARTAWDCAGSSMVDGLIVIQETAGGTVGPYMTGGTIEANIVGIHAGIFMDGGTLRVKEAGVGLGKYMKSGNLYADIAINVGEGMTGGTINVGTAKDVGAQMSGGEIIVGTFSELVAQSMIDGTIRLRGKAGRIVPIGEKDRMGVTRTGGTVRYEGSWAWWKNLFV